LLLVAGHGTYYVVLLSDQAIRTTFRIALGFSGSGLGFACGVLLLAGLLPLGRASQVADGLDDGAFGRVKLTSCFTNNIK
jgi:hypothetical protein